MPYTQQTVPSSRVDLPRREAPGVRQPVRRKAPPGLNDPRLRAQKRNKLLSGVIMIALCFGILQAARTLVQSTYQITVLARMLPAVEHYYGNARLENKILKDKIHRASTTEGIESLARNYLNMTTDHEVLIRFH
ncbi:MAG: hypothetical protein AB7P76_11980 [Candidatus Melainabacteria bacterium]